MQPVCSALQERLFPFCPHYRLPLRSQPVSLCRIHPEDEAGMPFFQLFNLWVCLSTFLPHSETPIIWWCCPWTWHIITDDSRTLVITTVFINLKCQPLLLSPALADVPGKQVVSFVGILPGRLCSPQADLHLMDITHVSNIYDSTWKPEALEGGTELRGFHQKASIADEASAKALRCCLNTVTSSRDNPFHVAWASHIAQLVKNPPAMWETWVRSLGWEDPLEKGKATHSGVLAWRIPWIIQFMGDKESDTTDWLSLFWCNKIYPLPSFELG